MTFRSLCLLPPIALLAACAASPPVMPDPVAGRIHRFSQADSSQTGHFDDAQWWQALGAPELDALLERAGRGNFDVRIAMERVAEARAGSVKAASRLLPAIAVAGSASEARSGLPAPYTLGQPDVRAYRGALETGWEIDLAGAARAAADATALDTEAAEEAVSLARWQLRVELARQFLIWQGARLRADVLERLLQVERDAERIVSRRAGDGQASRLDVRLAAAASASLQSDLPALHALIAVSAHRIAGLLGEAPGTQLAGLDPSAPAHLPMVDALPVGQPLDLLQRRPDLRIASRQLLAEAARLREREADLWPRFFLSAILGRQDLEINGRDLSPVRFGNAAIAFSLPLFNAGRLRAAVERQGARQRAATLRYEQTALQALEDVESSLVSLARSRERSAATARALDERQAALRLGDTLQGEGQIDPLQWQDLKRSALAAELDDIESRLQQALATVRLFQALGGGWSLTGAPMATLSIPSSRATPP